MFAYNLRETCEENGIFGHQNSVLIGKMAKLSWTWSGGGMGVGGGDVTKTRFYCNRISIKFIRMLFFSYL